MTAHQEDNVDYGTDHPNPHASQNKWRHQESTSFARHASPRDNRGGSNDLAQSVNKSRDRPLVEGAAGQSHPFMVAGNGYASSEAHTMAAQHDGVSGVETTQDGSTGLEVKCGPLLNYRRMENGAWFGSVLIVTRGGSAQPESPVIPVLKMQTHGNGANTTGPNGEQRGVANGVDYENGQGSAPINSFEPQTHTPNQIQSNGGNILSETMQIPGIKLYSDPENTFWRFALEVPMQQSQIRVEYRIPGVSFTQGTKTDKQNFYIPAISESMNIMFHSCNGFSVGTDEEAWSGAALWNDVQRVHTAKPFHVMIGGGDQIYNDGIRVNGPLRPWTDIGNPHKRKEFPFPETLRKDCDKYYVDNYIRWYSTEPFAGVNGQIAQLNMWDDHDIIDGFGSYVDDFMRCPVFMGIGGVANKYYLLFQHHLAPPLSTYTSDAPQTTSHDAVGIDPRQLENTFVLQEKSIDSSYIIGSKPGPYVVEHSRSIYARLGARIAFFGIDARTERTRKQVNYPETYQIIFDRLRKELGASKSSSSPIQHLIVLLGIPIAYPRLTWLENIFTSPLIAPIKFLNKRFGFGGGFFNHFDGNIDLLDDLDDHYTARTHKKERLFLVQQLQSLASEFSVRITILGGDVHLAAVGRFYSNLKLNIPIAEDYRYMANIISSAIVNKPPPQAVANLLARRNKLHHLDHDTDETLMKFFDKDPGNVSKTASWNKVTMPSRNWAMITENYGGGSEASVDNSGTNAHGRNGTGLIEQPPESNPNAKDGHDWLHSGEADAGTKHKAADFANHGKGNDNSLDVCIRVEKDQHDKNGLIEPYGMTIPTLICTPTAVEHHRRKRDALRHPLHH